MPRRLIDRGHPERRASGAAGRASCMRRPVAGRGRRPRDRRACSRVSATQLNPTEAQLKNFPGAGTAIDGSRPARRGRDQRRRDASRSTSSSRTHGGDARDRSRRSCEAAAASSERPRRRDWRKGPNCARRGVRRRSTAPRPAIQAIIDRAQDDVLPELRGARRRHADVAAWPPDDRDFLHALYGSFPYVLALRRCS